MADERFHLRRVLRQRSAAIPARSMRDRLRCGPSSLYSPGSTTSQLRRTGEPASPLDLVAVDNDAPTSATPVVSAGVDRPGHLSWLAPRRWSNAPVEPQVEYQRQRRDNDVGIKPFHRACWVQDRPSTRRHFTTAIAPAAARPPTTVNRWHVHEGPARRPSARTQRRQRSSPLTRAVTDGRRQGGTCDSGYDFWARRQRAASLPQHDRVAHVPPQ